MSQTASVALYIQGDTLLSVDAINGPRDFVFGKKLILEGAALCIRKLADESVILIEAVAK